MKLDLYIDFKSPAAYLALKPTMALIDTYHPEVTWHPYLTRQSPVPEPKADENKGETHRRVRAQARQDTHLKYAALQGTKMHFPTEVGATDLALAALLHLQEPRAFIEAAFNAYWIDALDLNDAQVVAALLAQCNLTLDTTQLSTEDLPAQQARAEEVGVVDAPAYVLDAGQLFIGREHLPRIRELLAG